MAKPPRCYLRQQPPLHPSNAIPLHDSKFSLFCRAASPLPITGLSPCPPPPAPVVGARPQRGTRGVGGGGEVLYLHSHFPAPAPLLPPAVPGQKLEGLCLQNSAVPRWLSRSYSTRNIALLRQAYKPANPIPPKGLISMRFQDSQLHQAAVPGCAPHTRVAPTYCGRALER